MLMMTIPGSTGKLHRMFGRHDDSGEHEEKQTEKKTYL
jgi:hypothetical protein